MTGKLHIPPPWCWPGDVTGWLTEAEGRRLALLALGRRVLEIGSYHGRSTVCMAQVADVVHAVDWHQGDSGIGPQWTLPAFVQTITDWKLWPKVVAHVGRSADVVPLFRPGTVDLAFIDGAHDVPSESLDLTLATNVLGSDGVIAVHDWALPSVKEAVAKVLGMEPVGVEDDLAWFRADFS